jgi:hypothetical protein
MMPIPKFWADCSGKNCMGQAPSHFEWKDSESCGHAAVFCRILNPSIPSDPSLSTSAGDYPWLPYSPRSSPIAQRLFESTEGETITLSSEQWEQYWPFMANAWTRNRQPYAPKGKELSGRIGTVGFIRRRRTNRLAQARGTSRSGKKLVVRPSL